MGIRPALQIFQPDEAAQRSSDAQNDALRKALASPLLGGTVVRGVAFVAGQNVVVKHGLGRVPSVWWVVDAQGAEARAYRVAWDRNTLTLRAVTTCTAAVHVS